MISDLATKSQLMYTNWLRAHSDGYVIIREQFIKSYIAIIKITNGSSWLYFMRLLTHSLFLVEILPRKWILVNFPSESWIFCSVLKRYWNELAVNDSVTTKIVRSSPKAPRKPSSFFRSLVFLCVSVFDTLLLLLLLLWSSPCANEPI